MAQSKTGPSFNRCLSLESKLCTKPKIKAKAKQITDCKSDIWIDYLSFASDF